MRVLELSWEYPPAIVGGLGRHVHRLSEALVAQGVAVDVITRGEAFADDGDVRVHRIAQTPFPRDVTAFLRWVAAFNVALTRRANELLATRDIDLVHSHDWLVAEAGRSTAARAGVPWLVTVHATEHGRHQGRIGAPPQAAIHELERRMTHDADHLITCSAWMREHVAEVFGVSRQRITVLPNGIELEASAPGEASASVWAPADAASPRPRGQPTGGNARLVLLAGRLVHEKGFDLALDALAEVLAAHDDVDFVVAGAGPAEAELRAQVRRLGLQRRGHFLGWLGDDELRELYRAAVVCVVPSRYEPFGIVALEAMAASCPPIVADTGGLREIVPADETVGLRVAPGDAEALSGAITRLLDDVALRSSMAARGCAHARRFDWAAIGAATRAVCERVLAGAATPAA